MECVILAGGLGTRLRSVVSEVPKCMAPVSGKPFLYYIFKYLQGFGCTRVILSVGYKHECIEDWIIENSWPFEILTIVEKTPLGTGGAIKLALGQTISNDVLVLNGDTFFNFDWNGLLKAHSDSEAQITIALKSMHDFDRYGSVTVDDSHRITQFNEKRFCKEGLINGGAYLINKRSKFWNFPQDKFSFETDVLQNSCNTLKIQGCISDSYFIDIGVPEDYEKANSDFKYIFNDL